MVILEVINLKKYFGDRLIISIDNLQVHSGDKIAIVGRNGAGKTTLLNILAGEIEPDEGIVRRYCNIAYIKQFSNPEVNMDTKLLKEFSVKDKQKSRELSGGEITRLKIADALSKDSILLFADEPTANLDYKGIELLKRKLGETESLFLVTHDRDLIEHLCNKIIEVKDGKLLVYNGSFSFYQEQKRLETEQKYFLYDQYAKEKERLEKAVIDREKRSKSVKKAPKRMGNSEARLHKRKANEKKEKIDGAANIMKTRIEKLEVVEKPRKISQIKFDFSLTYPPQNRIVISCKEMDFCYGSNRIFDKASFDVYNGSKTAIIGENGSGKTTLLNLINNREEYFTIAPRGVLGYFYQNFENLDHNKTILENVMRKSVQKEKDVRTILARLLFDRDDIYKKVGILSGGEKIKVSFAKLFVSNTNILLLDEPTNYLDMASIEGLEDILCQYDGTVLFVSHDKSFVNKIADRLLILEEKKLTEFEGNQRLYEEKINKDKDSEDNIKESILKMRLTEIISKMSLPNCQRDVLEKEYTLVLEQLQHYKNK